MTVDALNSLIGSTGLAVVIVICLIVGIYKAAPKILEAYKQGNQNLVDAIKELAQAFDSRISDLETKVDNIESKVDSIESEIRKESD